MDRRANIKFCGITRHEDAEFAVQLGAWAIGMIFWPGSPRAVDPALAPRHGIYDQYHHGDLDGYHVSYFRRRVPEGRAFHVCNLRKSYGFHLAAQGPDPLPGVADAAPPYHLRVDHVGAEVRFSINDLPILRFVDDGARYGPLLGGGKIGFRQMAPLVGEYANLSVHRARYLR